MSHINTTDMPVAFCLTFSLYSFILGMQTATPHRLWLWSGYFFAGLAMMAKGLIGVVFPAAILFCFISYYRDWRLLLKMRLFSGILIILAVNLPWVLSVQHRVPDFFHFYFIQQQFLRYATSIAGREMSKFAYIAIVLGGFFPWVIFLPQIIKSIVQKKEKNTLFFATWALFIIIFFFFSHSILIPYLLPILPPLAILAGKYFSDCYDNLHGKKSQKISLFAYGFLNFLLISAFFIALFLNKIIFSPMMGVSAALLFITGLLCFILPLRYRFHTLFVFILASSYLIFITLWFNYGIINNQQRSIKSFALTINTLMKKNPTAKIVSFGDYFQDLPYYTRQTVMVVDNIGELKFGFDHDPAAKQWMLSSNTFWKHWNSGTTFYVVIDKKHYNDLPHAIKETTLILQQTPDNILFTHRETP